LVLLAKKPRKSRNRGRFYFFLILLLGASLITFIDSQLRPALIALAEVRAHLLATQALAEAVHEATGESLAYDRFITVHTDQAGRPTWARLNTVEVNRLVTRTTRHVLATLEALREEDIAIPLGQAFGSALFAHVGPAVNFRIMPVGTVSVEVTDAFESAGINQTRHKIYLEIFADLRIVVPLLQRTVSVHLEVPVADVIYLGIVPETVVNLPFPLGAGFVVPPAGERPPLRP
jgi:sporulation protein YunB